MVRRFRGFLWVIVLLGLCACLGTTAKAADEDRIWGALVLATNVPKPKEPAPELKRFSGKIEKFFGYNQVELIGSSMKTVTADCERWLVPSQNFWLCVKSKQATENGYLLDITLFQDQRCLVTAKAKLSRRSPLLIRGPLHARGQLIIVLEVI